MPQDDRAVPSPSVRRRLPSEIAAWVNDRRRGLVDDLTTTIALDLLGSAGREPGENRRAAVAAAVDREVSTILTSIGAGRGLSAAQVAALAPISLTDSGDLAGHVLLRAHRVLCHTVWGALRDAARELAPDDPGTLRMLSSTLQVVNAQLAAEITRRHSERVKRLSERRPRERTEIGRLLTDASSPADPPPEITGMRDTLHVVAVATLDAEEYRQPALQRLLGRAAEQLQTGGSPIVERSDLGQVLIVPFAAKEGAVAAIADAVGGALMEAAAEQRAPITIGIGRPERGSAGVTRSYRQALRAVDTARMLADGPRVLTFEEAMPYLLLMADPALMNAFAGILDPLAAADRGHGALIETIAAFARNGGRAARASADLAIHRHTLAKRIDRIQRLTDLRLDAPDDLLVLRLAVMARRLVR